MTTTPTRPPLGLWDFLGHRGGGDGERPTRRRTIQSSADVVAGAPGLFVALFVFRLAPQLRGYLIQVLRSPLIASAVLCDAIAAAGLLVGAASLKASQIAFGCAVAFSTLAGLIVYHQIQSRATRRAKAIRRRYLWWLPPTILILITQAALGPRPAVVSWLDVLLRVAMPIGCVAAAYAIHRRRK